MTDTDTKAPWHLWAVGGLAVLFNAFGAYDHVMSLTQGAGYMASMGMERYSFRSDQIIPEQVAGMVEEISAASHAHRQQLFAKIDATKSIFTGVER